MGSNTRNVGASTDADRCKEVNIRWRCIRAGLLPAILASCGGNNDVTDSQSLSAEEERYADDVAAASANEFFTAAEASCVGEGAVRAFGLARAKELDLASENEPKLSRPDAETFVDVILGCANMAEALVRDFMQELDLSDSAVARCARLVDQSKVREHFVQIFESVDASATQQQLLDNMRAARAECSG